MPILAGLGPLGVPELLIIAFIVILVFGVGRLPEVGGAVGKGIREFRKATKDDENVAPDALDASAGAGASPASTLGGMPVQPAASAPMSRPEPTVATAAPPQASAAETMFCTECGTRNARGAKFCANCGTAIAAATR